jgi:2-methylcitrate dehydratase PrpD
MSNGGQTETLAKFATDLRFSDLPTEVIEKAKLVILDQLGCELAGSTLPWTMSVYRYVKSTGGSGESTIVNYGTKVNPELAAFTNAVFGHGFDVDDVNGHGRPGSPTIPPIIVAADLNQSTGADLLASVVAAYEVDVRVTNSVSPSAVVERGFHTPVSCNVFGAAAGVGKILELTSDQMTNAFGMAGSHAAGLAEFTVSGSEVKRLHAGIASVGGLRSAFLAREGYTGPRTVLEGKKGFCQAVANKFSLDRLTENLGRDWLIMKTGLKPYACATTIHSAITAVEKLYEENVLDPSNISDVVIGTNSFALGHAGGLIGPEPKDVTGMQYSLQYSIALALILRDNLFRGYSEANLKNTALSDLSKKVKMVLDQEVEEDYKNGKMSSRVSVRLKDGKVLEEKSFSKWAPHLPISKEDVVGKFELLARTVLSESQTQKLTDLVLNLEKVPETPFLTKLLVA